ncbi:hypothetical protein Tco_0625134 [Tanacetum coccineum]|uniref:Eukaryotic translation initiation factor 3 subunit G N-terminal domain-containing protein n=1 Tax=Tanacetum coccineum TaxID=301880 RepID=A0ABQ4WFZ1_9ASTR
MADHSQKWHDGSSSRIIESNSNTKGITAIVSKLYSLGRDIKKLKENVHAIQVGCQLCRGSHLDKECPLNEEVKSFEVVKYGEFGRSINPLRFEPFKTLPKTASEVPNSSVGQFKAVYANDEATVENTSSNETNEVSFLANNEARVA